MAMVVVPVEVWPVRKPRVGIWCDACALPSIAEQDWVVINPAMHSTIARRTTSICTECNVTTERARL